MNSLVSPTKVITNDIISNPIVAAHNPIALPQSLPVTSIGIPIMNVKTDNDHDDKHINKHTELDEIDTEDEKLSDTKKSDESMPVEDDSIIEMAQKIEENIGETDVEVIEPIEIITEPIEIITDPIKLQDTIITEQSLIKNDDLSVMSDHLNTIEPMECASVISMASPKHTMTTDVIMAESISVGSISAFVFDQDTEI